MRLIAFGDSWTAGHGVETNSRYKEDGSPDAFTQKLREQNSWPGWVGHMLGIPAVNMGVVGRSNERILKDLREVKKLDVLEQSDIIIVMFSYPYRGVAKGPVNVLETYLAFEHELKDFKHFYFNSFYPTFKDEQYDTLNLQPYFINPDGSMADLLREYEATHDVSVWEYGSRSVWNDEKNFWTGDYHPNALGYKVIGEYVYNQIKDNL
jgi:lysophospholipase L1-like esterase